MSAVAAAIIGSVGALLPAITGQQVGEPDTAVFWIGAALGAVGAVTALTLAVRALARPVRSRLTTTAAIVALPIAGFAALMTAALLFSG